MQKFTKVLLLLIMVLIAMYFFLPSNPYISKSKIHGDGLFAGKNYKKGTDDRADAIVIARAGEFLIRNKDNEGFLTEKIILMD